VLQQAVHGHQLHLDELTILQACKRRQGKKCGITLHARRQAAAASGGNCRLGTGLSCWQAAGTPGTNSAQRGLLTHLKLLHDILILWRIPIHLRIPERQQAHAQHLRSKASWTRWQAGLLPNG
jgi:hypothetical protein